MTPLAKRRAIEETVEFSGELVKAESQTLKKLRALSGGEDASILLLEATEAGAEQAEGRSLKKAKRTKKAVIAKFDKDVFVNAPIAFPVLFTDRQHVRMSRPELMTEISVIMAMSRPTLIEGPHIYSIEVLEPKNLPAFIDVDKLAPYFGGTVPTDIKSGYIYGPLLYDSPDFLRSILLEGVLANATEVEISLRSPSSALRRHVTLSQV